LNNIANSGYEAENYSRLRLFNLHSWLPFYTDITERDPSGMEFYPGFMIFSQNILGTSVGGISYFYDHGSHFIRPEISWTGSYPVITFSGNIKVYENMPQVENEAGNRSHNGNEYRISGYVPLLFARGQSVMQVIPRLSLDHLDMGFREGASRMKGIDLFETELYFSYYRRKSYRDIYTRLGISSTVSYTSTPLNKNSFGNNVSISGVFYLPGVSRHHSFYLRSAYQKQDRETYYLPIAAINRPRGYEQYIAESQASVSINYTMPVFYPDWSVPSVIYIRRLWLNAYYDYSYGENIMELKNNVYSPYTGSYSSYGAEIYADINPLRFIFPVSAGIRIGYMPAGKDIFTDFIISVSTSL